MTYRIGQAFLLGTAFLLVLTQNGPAQSKSKVTAYACWNVTNIQGHSHFQWFDVPSDVSLSTAARRCPSTMTPHLSKVRPTPDNSALDTTYAHTLYFSRVDELGPRACIYSNVGPVVLRLALAEFEIPTGQFMCEIDLEPLSHYSGGIIQ